MVKMLVPSIPFSASLFRFQPRQFKGEMNIHQADWQMFSLKLRIYLSYFTWSCESQYRDTI